MRYKQSELSECSRDYLAGLISELEEQKAAGHAVNETLLAEAREAFPNAPLYFVTHAY